MLLNSGLSLVSSGAGPRVLELLTLLSPSDRQLPKMLLVSAYADSCEAVISWLQLMSQRHRPARTSYRKTIAMS